jgi:hypothetical protein
MSFQSDFWGSFPKGTILPFAGDFSDKPEGWELCDGSRGTVNLVDRLPMGTATVTQIGLATEGTLTHTHGFTTGQTTQTDNIGGIKQDPHDGGGIWVGAPGHKHALGGVTTDSSSTLPPVTRVYFIQKVR